MDDIPSCLLPGISEFSQSTQKTELDLDLGKSQGKYTKKQKVEKFRFEAILSTAIQRTFHLLCQGETAPLNSFYYSCSCSQDAGGKGERIGELKH